MVAGPVRGRRADELAPCVLDLPVGTGWTDLRGGNNSNSSADEAQLAALRATAAQLGQLAAALEGHCACPAMTAGPDVSFLCPCHPLPTVCCAADYVAHTLEAATQVLTSEQWFAPGAAPAAGCRQVFTSTARRLNRVLAHAWFHHRPVFLAHEQAHGTAAAFLALAQQHQWLEPRSRLLPPEAGAPPDDDGVANVKEGGLKPATVSVAPPRRPAQGTLCEVERYKDDDEDDDDD